MLGRRRRRWFNKKPTMSQRLLKGCLLDVLCTNIVPVDIIVAFPVAYSTAVKAKHLYNICTMSEQRRRRWAVVVKMLYKMFVFAGTLLV